jgi:hypothetical protein
MKKDQQQIIKSILENIFKKEDNVKSYILKPESTKKDQALAPKKLLISSRKIEVQEYFPRIADQFKTLSLPFEIELFDSKQLDEKIKRNKIPFWNTNQIVIQSTWRLCPIGKSWVRRHPKHLQSGTTTDHDGHCRLNTKGRDILHADEIKRIPELEIFKNAPIKASVDKLVFGEAANKYNELINGWCAYWNEILKPDIPLHPNYIKALMATESSFNKNPLTQNKEHKAIGLMQIMPETIGYLSTQSKDIKNHYIEMNKEDAKDPSVAIAAATRWLFRKYRLVKGNKKNATWMDALEEYKGITKQKGPISDGIRNKLNDFFNDLSKSQK